VDLGLFSFALAAGALATLNPCGFVMLPALVAVQLQQVAGSGDGGRAGLILRGLAFALQATTGFVVVFAVLGLAIGIGARSIISLFPLGGLLIGLALLLAGLWSLLGRRPIPLPGLRGRPFGGRTSGGLGFGAAYAVASLSCTLPIFLAVVGGGLVADGPAGALLPLVGYALGMGSVLLAVTLATGLSAGALVRALRAAMPFVETAGAALLTVVGAYLVVYWLPHLGR
jgi:cytochrome c biogenesis protein CcdA